VPSVDTDGDSGGSRRQTANASGSQSAEIQAYFLFINE